ncbi:MAG TPA: hypothetical protein VH092_16625 [Urbifossiella sp.]|jgi:hypothetical protein|nr:hypothetical protein [Urbifossiella sp.]
MITPRRLTVEPLLDTDAAVADLVARFEGCTWPFPQWTHRAHLAVAVSYLRQFPFPAALDRAREQIQHYNRTCGTADGYHETITVVFMRVVAAYLARHPDAGPARAVAELAGTCDMAWLKRHYSAERLGRAEAKTAFIDPDLRAFDF